MPAGKRLKNSETIQKVGVKKTSQINRMVKTAGIAGNRFTAVINFYWETVRLIPIHGLCVAEKKVNTFIILQLFLSVSCFLLNVWVYLIHTLLLKLNEKT